MFMALIVHLNHSHICWGKCFAFSDGSCFQKYLKREAGSWETISLKAKQCWSLKRRQNFAQTIKYEAFLQTSFHPFFFPWRKCFSSKEEENPHQKKCFIVRVELFKDLSSFSRFFSLFKSGLCNASINYQCLVVLLFFGDIKGGRKRNVQRGDIKIIVQEVIRARKVCETTKYPIFYEWTSWWKTWFCGEARNYSFPTPEFPTRIISFQSSFMKY